MNNIVFNVSRSYEHIDNGDIKMEKSREEIEHVIVLKICELVCEVLNVKETRIVQPLLERSISETINNRDERRYGLLQQYLAYELEILGDVIRRDLIIPKEIKINHEYQTYSKFNDIIEYIKKNYVKIEDINSDGTFDTIYNKKVKLQKEMQEMQESHGFATQSSSERESCP